MEANIKDKNNITIKSFSVHKLHGIFNHTLNINPEEHIHILSAPNGFGKTSMLKLLNFFFNSIQKLATIEFEYIEVKFIDNNILRAKKGFFTDDSSPHKITKECIEYSLFSNGRGRPKKFNYIIDRYTDEHEELSSKFNPTNRRIVYNEFPELRYIGAGKYKNMNTREIFHHSDLIAIINSGTLKLPPWLKKIISSQKIKFVETQRLLQKNTTSEHSIEVVKEYANDLASKIETKLAESANIAQVLDRTFPRRLIDEESSKIFSEKEIKDKFKRIEQKRKNLVDAGILDKDTSPYSLQSEKIDECKRSLLYFYATDIEEKLLIYDEIYLKIKLLQDICNAKFKFKTMHVSKNKGYYFTIDGASKKSILPLSELSSGEQHELVLNYDLLFRTEEYSLVLIDEPELSLHVAWQLKYIEDLKRINKLTKHSAIIATHSPQIINKRWDLVQELSTENIEG